MTVAYSGVFRAGTGGHALWVAQWPSFEAKWKELSNQGLRLANVSVSVEGDQQPVFAGTFREGTDAHALWVAQWPSFEAKWKELSNQGLRLNSIATYIFNGVPHFAGTFRAGTDAHALWVAQWPSFEAKWKELSNRGLRLTSIATYIFDGIPHYAGTFRAGTDANALWVAQWPSFEAKWKELSSQGLRLVGMDSYVHNGQRFYAGAYRQGSDGHFLWVGVDWENFVAQWHGLNQQGLRLVDTTMFQHPCQSDCLNQVVMPDGSYDYGITRTATHCPGLPGSCGAPGDGEVVTYSWPVDLDGSARYVRLSALQHSDRFLTLPFSDTTVKRRGIWRYGDGGWHHAADYSRDDSNTFQVLACAPGRVIHVGWDNWSGNTVIVSHDVGGVQDAYRTIYMHLRNGATHDCDAAWNLSVPTLSGDNLAQYTEHLNATGCPQNPPRNPATDHWGTNQETIPVTVNQVVGRGAFLGWCGNTGPGGKRGAGGPNTHLHVFFARRDPSNDHWYFFDPYGVYAMPNCYAAGVTDATSGPCVRYPIAWQDGRPQYP